MPNLSLCRKNHGDLFRARFISAIGAHVFTQLKNTFLQGNDLHTCPISVSK